MALSPTSTNRMTCTVCGWSRIIDHARSYRGGHTNAENGVAECHERLDHEEVDPRAPHSSWFEVESAEFTPEWVEENVNGELVMVPVPVE